MFKQPLAQVKFPELEARIREFWNERGIYEKSLARRAGAERFVFYEGPPTANGLPHPGHCLTRAIKDIFPRYRTMRGYHCERKAGWDTHGLPVEVEVCKELGIHSKEEIEAFGVEPFIHRCLESVFRYTREWEELTQRLGFWIHLDEAYVTYHQSFVESVWWALARLFDAGLLYRGHKIVWWWAQGGTALSSGEVGQGYRQVADPSVFVRFPLVPQTAGEPASSLVVWTTTPWTLPSNQFAAVHPDFDYAICEVADTRERLIVAAALVEPLSAKFGLDWTIVETVKGNKLVGRRYVPPFDYYSKQDGEREGRLRLGGREFVAWRIVPADFVTLDSGTGIVHQAPAFGEVDYEVLQREIARFEPGEGPELICAVAPDGRFSDEAPDYVGRWVKEADKDIARELKHRGLLVHQEQYLHDYPFCWRAEEDPLIQYPRQSWFIRTTKFRDEMLANNRQINWLPEHIRDGRFGNFLESNVDWALSRERYWGTPLPIWVCEETGHMEAISSYAELLAKPGVDGTQAWDDARRKQPGLSEHLKVHKPYIDAVTYDSPKAAGARMRRVSEVIDCWFDSGAMPFAQWGFPHTGREQFAAQFPADFISEAIDQTRGWFYSQLAISTMLFGQGGVALDEAAKAGCLASKAVSPSADRTPTHPGPRPQSPVPYPHPFRNCIVLGLMLGEDGNKMSKQKRNYREPAEIFDRYGADALRWYFFANQPPWTSIRYSEQAIRDSIPEVLLRLWNTYIFFAINALADRFDPAAEIVGDAGQLDGQVLQTAASYSPIAKRSELDRWILSELNRTVAAVVERMDAYDNYAAAGYLTDFLDALSNWYVRRSRDRFWSGTEDQSKSDARWTLYECLLTLTRLMAPFTPFVAEELWQRLACDPFGGRVLESVHLTDFPAANDLVIDRRLSDEMRVVREIVSQGRSARTVARLKVRQPLAKVEIVLTDPAHRSWLADHAALIREELNVKDVEFPQSADTYIDYAVLPDLKRLGPRLGKQLPALKQALAGADAAQLLAEMQKSGQVAFDLPGGAVTLDRDDLQVRLKAKAGWAAADGPDAVVVLSTELTTDLIEEGLAREVLHAIQALRKEIDCQYTDRIELAAVTTSDVLRRAIQRHREYLCTEALIANFQFEPIAGVGPKELDVDGHPLTLFLRVVPA